MSAPTPATLLNAVVTTGAGTGVRVASPGAQVHVYSSAGSSCTVLIQGSQDNSVWKTLKALTDPPAAPNGFVYIGTSMPYMRANVTARVSGTITAKLISLDADPGPWASIESPENSAGALTVTSLTDSGLTATRVPIVGTDGLIQDDATLVFDSTTKELSATAVKSGSRAAQTVKSGDGAITVAPSNIVITKGSAAALTLAAPTPTTHDGYRITILSTTAYAHVITFPSGKINGGSNVTITFGAAAGTAVTVEAYQGVWYTKDAIGTVTVA